MTNAEFTGEITSEIVETDRPSFIPGGPVIVAVLKPSSEATTYLPPVYPVPPPPLTRPSDYIIRAPEVRACVVDIETTGFNPWESRIICIGAADISDPDNIVVFHDMDEAKMLNAFLTWFNARDMNQIIGYSVAFDYRFIFYKAMQHRIRCGAWSRSTLFDLRQIMAQVKEAFVYKPGKSGSLAVNAEALLGEKKLMTGEDVLLAWEQKRINDIIDYCRKDVDIELLLYALVLWTKEEI